ncbi:hypothetical protein NIES19_59600 (plasmid) [Anabaena cylindrica PCC 7122]|nr:hypothetical protein NIES19_59600 [Anabaena cylindrica PCC 7122]
MCKFIFIEGNKMLQVLDMIEPRRDEGHEEKRVLESFFNLSPKNYHLSPVTYSGIMGVPSFKLSKPEITIFSPGDKPLRI